MYKQKKNKKKTTNIFNYLPLPLFPITKIEAQHRSFINILIILKAPTVRPRFGMTLFFTFDCVVPNNTGKRLTTTSFPGELPLWKWETLFRPKPGSYWIFVANTNPDIRKKKKDPIPIHQLISVPFRSMFVAHVCHDAELDMMFYEALCFSRTRMQWINAQRDWLSLHNKMVCVGNCFILCSFMPRLYPQVQRMMMRKMFMVRVYTKQFQNCNDNETRCGGSSA